MAEKTVTVQKKDTLMEVLRRELVLAKAGKGSRAQTEAFICLGGSRDGS
ncbi:hypothetical protein M1N89_00525 [Dehalococcoidia bacterium]|nr:hypothetical protein [Dehalococcoidia bacterium]